MKNIQNIMSDQDVIQKIKQEVEKINKTENYSNLGKAFDFWVLTTYFELNDETAATSIIESPNDKGVDAFIEEEGNIKIIQCKFFDSTEKKVGSNDIALFKGCLDWLHKPEEVKKLNLPGFYNAALTFVERWKEGADVQLHFFVFGRFSSTANHERKVFNNSDNKEKVQMYFHDIDDILKLCRARSQEENPLVNEKAKFKLMPGEYFVKKGDMPSIVATIKAQDLAKMYNEYGDSLFERNIRFFRGARKESINAKIIDTVLDDNERGKFWYYNNGISFVCRDFTINDEIDPHVLEVKGFQVINGCQTTVCLSESKKRAENWEGIPEEVQVIVRFIKAPINEVDLITLYTNSQNPVKEIQLKSNDPTQKRLKKELHSSTPPYFYSIKEGDWQRFSAKEKNKFKKGGIIEMSTVTQAIYSFNNDPVFARRWKDKLFSEKYDEIFRKDISKEELILPWKILQVINENIANYRRNEFNQIKKDTSSFTEENKESILRKEFLIYSNLIILHFIGKLVKKRYSQYSSKIAEKLLNNRLEERIKKLFDYIVGILQFSDKLTEEINLYRFLMKSENINILYNEIQKAIKMEQARTRKDPLKEMLPEIQ